MKTNLFAKTLPCPRLGAFSLVEVAIALGVVSFGLVAVLGTLPVAMNSSRQSINQTRAAELACSVFSSFRAQPFSSVCYVDAQFGSDGITPSGSGPMPIDLRVANTPTGSADDTVSKNPQNASYNVDNQYLRFFAAIDQIDPTTPTPSPGNPNPPAADPSRVHYSVLPPAGGGYQIILHFTSVPDGTSGSGVANRIDMLLSATDHPVDYYRFTSTIANRNGTLTVVAPQY